MKLFQKRPVAVAVMVLAMMAGVLLGNARRPDGEASTSVMGSYRYVMDSESVISEKTMAYIDNMNMSLFAQTGAQIAVIVVDTTGDTEIGDYTEQEFDRLGVGAKETNNGVLLVLALRNVYNGAADGDYSAPGSRTPCTASSWTAWRTPLPRGTTTRRYGKPSTPWWTIWRTCTA